MVLEPDKHSFAIYKANIIYMYHSTIGKNEENLIPSLPENTPASVNEVPSDPAPTNS